MISKSVPSSKDIYKPKLWYFPLMTFLNDQYLPMASRSNLDTNHDEININELSDTAMELNEDPRPEDLLMPTPTSTTSTDTTFTKSQSTRSLKINSEVYLIKDDLLSVQNHLKRPASQDDRYDIFGKGVALKLRDLNKTQRLLAEKMINEALFEAEMGNLTMLHKVMTPTLT
ncbi:Hypothetical protein CINCED_3A001302 [Cinara cedri]|uniref:Uncharacterized protein n=1 Tax=Cinara cedri TaxID=506608 RepID=A0A5E4N777_9HEMI|nr:Hypothetical protein CINCED_3A001302 [Cinara cedri]